MKPDGMLALLRWEDEGEGEKKTQTPYMYFFKHGLDEEKVVSFVVQIFICSIILYFQAK